jgi:hypothetical protein
VVDDWLVTLVHASLLLTIAFPPGPATTSSS